MKVKDNSPLNGLIMNEGDYEYIQRQTAIYLQATAEFQGLADRWDRGEITTDEYCSKGNVLILKKKNARKNIEELIDKTCGLWNKKNKSVKTALFGDNE